jgi:hypothetical protein
MGASIKLEGGSRNSMTSRKNHFEKAFPDYEPGYMIRRGVYGLALLELKTTFSGDRKT